MFMNENVNKMDCITICDLELFCNLGVPEEERSKPQRILLTIQIYYPFEKAAKSDEINDAVDYQQIVNDITIFCKGKNWKLIETFSSDIAKFILEGFNVESVSVAVRKFIIPQTKYISAELTRKRSEKFLK